VLVVPAYNEEACIREVLLAWERVMQALVPDSFKIVVINDGSKDRTGSILDALAAEQPQILVFHQPNGGHGSAVVRGYEEALALLPEWVGQVDSDDQFRAEEFRLLWDKREYSDFILGWRQKRFDPQVRKIISAIMRNLTIVLGAGRIRDPNIPFRLIRSQYLATLLKRIPVGVFAPNIFLSCAASSDGVDLQHIPVTHIERATGEVSIVRMSLVRACIRTARELFQWRLSGRIS